MTKYISIVLLRTFLFAFAAILGFARNANAQSLILGEDPYTFESLGIDAEGQVFISTDNGGFPRLLRLTKAGLETLKVTFPGWSELTEMTRVSRDARHVVGTARDADSYDHVILWSTTNLSQPRDLGYLDGSSTMRPNDIASTANGPVIIGRARRGSFLWTESNGFRYWPTNGPPFSQFFLERMTRDGTTFVGSQIFLVGTNWSECALVASETGFSFLDCRDSLRAEAFAISPNGSHICGHMDLQSAIWEKEKARTLSFGTNIHILTAITDSGWAIGVSSVGPVIYDSRGRKLEPFDQWWAESYPDAPLPGPITRVRDFYEYDGKLYLLLTFYDGVIGETRGLLAIAPFERHGKAD